MAQINDDYLKLPGSYLFADIAHKVNAFKENHPEMELIRLGIGDVTRPLPPSVIKALHKAVDEQATAEGFRGYGPEQGYRFLREAIAQGDFASRGVEIDPDDIFVSDGAKCDLGNFQELFGRGNVIAVTDPVYPVYVDSNVMGGRAGTFDGNGSWSGIVYLPCSAENGFVPSLPLKRPDVIYLCLPNNPTGTALSRPELQRWVDSPAAISALSCSMRRMRPIFGRTASPTAFMSWREPKRWLWSSAVSPSPPGLPGCAAGMWWSPKP